MLEFAKKACASLLLGQVWYDQLTDKSLMYLRQLNNDIVSGVSIHVYICWLLLPFASVSNWR